MKTLRLILGVLVLLALIAYGGFSWLVSNRTTSGATSSAATPVALVNAPFDMVDQDGKVFHSDQLKGQWSLVFFGYTYCPDICPLTLQNLSQTLDTMGVDGKKFHIYFITVDPERDRPEDLKNYLNARGFPGGVTGLTGSPQQIAAAAKAFRASYEKVGEGKHYTMNHTSVIYVLNPDGAFVLPLMHDLEPAKNAKMLKNALAEDAKRIR